MNILFNANTQNLVTLKEKIITSSDGYIYNTDCKGLWAKIYYNPTAEQIEKLEAIIAHSQGENLLDSHYPHYGLPLSFLLNHVGNKVGFLIQEIHEYSNLSEICKPEFNWQTLHNLAQNITSLFSVIHKAGYVIGDIELSDILVTKDGLPQIIHTDLFQFVSKDGKIYHSTHIQPEITPPELIGINLHEIEQTKENDLFRLAVIIFRLLFGYHPFSGVWLGQKTPLDIKEWIKHGYWVNGVDSQVSLGEGMIPIKVLHPKLEQLFLRCFNEGHTQPNLRPTVEEWKQVLTIASSELKQCSKVPEHFYRRDSHICYWCARASIPIPKTIVESTSLEDLPFPPAIDENLATPTVISKEAPKYSPIAVFFIVAVSSFALFVLGLEVFIPSDQKPKIAEDNQLSSSLPIELPPFCRMSTCTQTLITDQKMVQGTYRGTLFAVTYATRSWANETNPTMDFAGSQTSHVFCSFRSPMAIYSYQDHFIANLLSPSNFPHGYEESTYHKYWAVCHPRQYRASKEFSDLQRKGSQIGYSSSRSSRQITLTSPQEALRIETVLQKLAVEKLGEKDYHGALSLLEQVIRINPDLASAYFYQGNAYFALGEFSEAERSYSGAIRLNSESGFSYFQRGQVRLKLKIDELALEDFKHAARLLRKTGQDQMFNTARKQITLLESRIARLTPPTVATDPEFPFPMSACGDAMNNEPSTWYPVYVDFSPRLFAHIKRNYCGDAIMREIDRRKLIQVASFLDANKAHRFASLMQRRVGSGIIGTPHFYPPPPEENHGQLENNARDVCGDSSIRGQNIWFPVYVEYSNEMLTHIRTNFCRDAISTFVDGRRVIQVASFSSYRTAANFAQMLRSQVNSGRVGNPTIRNDKSNRTNRTSNTPQPMMLCIVADPTGTPLNVRNAPNGQIVSSLVNGTEIYNIRESYDNQGRSWALVAEYSHPSTRGKTLGWVFRNFIRC